MVEFKCACQFINQEKSQGFGSKSLTGSGECRIAREEKLAQTSRSKFAECSTMGRSFQSDGSLQQKVSLRKCESVIETNRCLNRDSELFTCVVPQPGCTLRCFYVVYLFGNICLLNGQKIFFKNQVYELFLCQE